MKTKKLLLGGVLSTVLLTACHDCLYEFQVGNVTDKTITMTLSGCGEYSMESDEGMWVSPSNFSNKYAVRKIFPKKSLSFSATRSANDNPTGNYKEDKLIPFWEYIHEIKVGDEVIDSTSWRGEEHWDRGRSDFGGQTITYTLLIGGDSLYTERGK